MFELTVLTEQRVMSEKYASDGVGLLLKPLDVPLRAAGELAAAKYRAQVYDLGNEAEDIKMKVDPWVRANLNPDGTLIDESNIPDDITRAASRILEIQDQMMVLRNGFVLPIWIRIATKTVLGVSINGQSPSVDEFIRFAPPEMIQELGNMILGKLQLSAKVQENLGSPTTSGAVDGGLRTPTTASSAVPTVASTPTQEIASGIFQKLSESLPSVQSPLSPIINTSITVQPNELVGKLPTN